ncbi:MAG: DNA polymerase III subunit beta [Alphaproteobacteria bacterium]|nr:DNA polymerase III subunit beta [Rhodospirillaceae bacterium]MBT6205536.1 DNA polymerase III subunit beta [Rhodospirillaceae bacterium]MBT6509442.1 DNA polymerase III subunit beta [Rhodospirillaceae bacterium]MBT7648279.1 DNA polymerase III subunit beta [Rhodospirillaceae bacterium]MDG2482113.1 DNA polymerase III subunit beta [Alphaproteobacteria bacterium]
MKLAIERAVLLRALAHVQSVVERRNTIPILSNVRLEASDNSLRLTATDMDLEVVEAVPADLQVAGATTAPAHVLYDICRKLPEGSEVALDATGDSGRLSISCGRIHFRLPCLPPEDFPVMSGSDFSHSFALPASELRRLVDKTRFAISTEETRYYLNGIYLHSAETDGGPMLRAVATDGHRLARIDSEQPDGAGGMPGIIVPRKAVAELRKLVDEIDGAVAIELSDTKIRFAFDTVVLTSKLIDGTFPDYERVIPQGNDKMLEMSAASFIQAVDRMAAISTDKSRSIKLALEPERLVLSANSPDSASGEEELPVDYDGPSIEIGFNSRYVLEMAQNFEGEQIRFRMADAVSPTIVHDTSDDRTLYVLMPMRV